MQLRIDLSPQISEQLAEAARTRGMDPAKLVESLVADSLPLPSSGTRSAYHHPRYKTPQEDIAAMDAIAERNVARPTALLCAAATALTTTRKTTLPTRTSSGQAEAAGPFLKSIHRARTERRPN